MTLNYDWEIQLDCDKQDFYFKDFFFCHINGKDNFNRKSKYQNYNSLKWRKKTK